MPRRPLLELSAGMIPEPARSALEPLGLDPRDFAAAYLIFELGRTGQATSATTRASIPDIPDSIPDIPDTPDTPDTPDSIPPSIPPTAPEPPWIEDVYAVADDVSHSGVTTEQIHNCIAPLIRRWTDTSIPGVKVWPFEVQNCLATEDLAPPVEQGGWQ